MKLIDSVKPGCVIAQAEVEDKDALLQLIAATAAKSESLSGTSRDEILKALRAREDLDSTGYGDGIAIPHCRLPGVDEFLIGIITLASPVDFEAIDDQAVNFIAFIIAPDTESKQHIRILSQISRVLQISKAIKEMRGIESAENLRESFLRWAVDEPDTEPAGKNLFHVFIQEEAYFQDILQIFGSINASTAFVMEIENSSAYLAKLPLFAGFWSDNPEHFGRMIVALVPKNMTNEAIRRIEQVTGKLSDNPGVILTVQSLFYCDGESKA